MRMMSPCSARMPTKRLPPMMTRANIIKRFRSVVSFAVAGDEPDMSRHVGMGRGSKEDALSIADSQRSGMINGAVLFLGDRGRDGGGDTGGCVDLEVDVVCRSLFSASEVKQSAGHEGQHLLKGARRANCGSVPVEAGWGSLGTCDTRIGTERREP